MKKYHLFTVIFLLLTTLVFGSWREKVPNHPFKINQAFYQSWVISENEKGTNVVLVVSHVKKEVTFVSILFRGMELEIFITPVGKTGRFELKGILPSGRSRINVSVKPTPIALPDQLIYLQNGVRKNVLLKLNRKKTLSFPQH